MLTIINYHSLFSSQRRGLIRGALQNKLLQRKSIGTLAMRETWNTKDGPRRVRFDPPTLREAIVAAEGLTGDPGQQAEIAAALMEVAIEDVRAQMAAMPPPRRCAKIVTSSGRDGCARAVIVEKRPNRHFVTGQGLPRQGPAVRAFPSSSSGESLSFLRPHLLERRPVRS